MIKTITLSILSAVVLMGCTKTTYIEECNCGLVSKIFISWCGTNPSYIEVMNDCSGNKKVFYLTVEEVQDLKIADEYCPQETRW